MSRTIIVERIAYTVFAIDAGKRLKTWARIGAELKPITATTEERLRKKLRKISVDLLNGDVASAELENSDSRSYIAAREILAPHRLSVDQAARELASARDALAPLGALSVDIVAREYAAARAELGGVSLSEAIRFYRQHSGQLVGIRTVAEVAAEFLRLLARKSDAYREIFSYDLKRLCLAVGERPIGDVTTVELESYVSATGHKRGGEFVPASDWRREQVRKSVITFFNFARRKKYLPKFDTAAHGLEREQTICEAREVWDPEHLRRALETVSAHESAWLPWLALSAFGNVRSTPTRRLEWANFHWLDSLIELHARKSKVKKRVTVAITATLASWIENYRGQRGPITPAKGFGAFTARLRNKYGLPYYKNILRRSFITYLLAQTDDEEMVALVANTSVARLRENYRQIRTFAGRLVTKELAAAWFATARVSAENVVQLELRGGGRGL